MSLHRHMPIRLVFQGANKLAEPVAMEVAVAPVSEPITEALASLAEREAPAEFAHSADLWEIFNQHSVPFRAPHMQP